MKLRNSPQRTLLATGVLAALATHPAHAIVLQQKWTAGQQLAYDVLVNGTANIQLPPDANNMLAGLPLDIDLNMQGQTALDTLAVDEAGTGTVAMRVNPLQVKGDMLGQKLLLAVQDGKGAVTINGKAMGNAVTDWSALNDPATAMRISKVGRVEGFIPTKPQVATPAALPGDTKPKPKARAGMPFDMQGMVGTMMLRALPTLWPDHEVNVGDKWTTALNFPTPAAGANGAAPPVATGAGATTAPVAVPGTPLGKFDFTLKGEEEVGGRKTERIGVKGVVDVDEDAATALTHSLPLGSNAPKVAGVGFQHARQQLSGDLWFDAAAGQVVRGEFDVKSTVTTHAGATPTATAAQDKATPVGSSTMSFNGTVQMQLRKVSYASANNTTRPGG